MASLTLLSLGFSAVGAYRKVAFVADSGVADGPGSRQVETMKKQASR